MQNIAKEECSLLVGCQTYGIFYEKKCFVSNHFQPWLVMSTAATSVGVDKASKT
jgi:hypothetical protein